MTRVFQVTAGGLASLFDAHHAQEAAEHGECSCPPGICIEGAAPVDPSSFPIIEQIIGDVMSILADDELDDEGELTVEFEPDFEFDDEPEALTPAQQLDQLGDIVEDVTALAGLYATMVHAERGRVTVSGSED
ncbi:hypothetical protein [Bradyrhizobium sp. SZCCHNRI2010]|uniref:hypothetical protein n=1 Tax=Bradyrhizobium sp. SZCCHNRI2010 TaxID=3057283 RepID=UPI0028E87D72|nr:hypothetical protein [Bradyrhizobium sp. SZCCHNRI2010]